MPTKDEELTADRLMSGDRPSIFIAGMAVAQAMRKSKTVVLMMNVLGKVVLMPPEAIKVLAQPRVSDAELNDLGEDEALQVMLQEGRPENEMVEYLKRREVSVREG